MNRTILSVLLLIGFISVLSACNKSANTTTPVGTMSALVTANQWEPGAVWNCNNAAATNQLGNTVIGYTPTLFIAGVKTTGAALNGFIGLFIANYNDTAGTFKLDQTANVGTYLTINGSDTTIHQIIYGQVVITSGTAHAAQGYFTFTCKDSTKISNGVFNVAIQ